MMAAPTFAEYLKGRRIADNAAGDFVTDAKDDSRMSEFTSWDQLETYLITRSAIPDAITAAKVVWAGYQAKLKRGHS
jgi:hypothetical protein